MNSIAKLINFRKFIHVFISLSFINSINFSLNCEIIKNKNIDEIDFENALNQNSVQFHEYENPKTLFDDFFGLGDPLNESNFGENFQDLTLQIDSKNVRELYEKKLLEMSKNTRNNKKDKLNWSFFNKRI